LKNFLILIFYDRKICNLKNWQLKIALCLWPIERILHLSVNFINIICANFSYESLFWQLFLVTFWLWQKNLYKKFACKSLMILTLSVWNDFFAFSRLKANVVAVQKLNLNLGNCMAFKDLHQTFNVLVTIYKVIIIKNIDV